MAKRGPMGEKEKELWPEDEQAKKQKEEIGRAFRLTFSGNGESVVETLKQMMVESGFLEYTRPEETEALNYFKTILIYAGIFPDQNSKDFEKQAKNIALALLNVGRLNYGE